MIHQDYSTVDGNEAAARIAYAASEVIAIYPITPATPMGEMADEWASQKKLNILGGVPQVIEMQREGAPLERSMEHCRAALSQQPLPLHRDCC